MILIAYDGSADADHAIAVAASLVHGGTAHVMYIWQPLSSPEERLAVGSAWTPVGAALEDEIAQEERRARDIAEAGVEVAVAAGFEADGEAVRGDGPPAEALERAIDRLRPRLVVIGSRGLTGLKAILKGSVSRHVGAHAHAPVLIVPPARMAGA